MIILPDRNIPRASFLMPVYGRQWRASSQAEKKDQGGNPNQTRFRLTATRNGKIIWKAWFDDRSDFDAFLFAIFQGTLRQQPALWRLADPQWHPDLVGPDVFYQHEVVTFLSNYPGEILEWITPADWTPSLQAPGFLQEGEYLFWTGTPAFLTSGTASTSPANWNPSTNTVEGIGGGGNSIGNTFSAPGGGGGAYAKATNVNVAANTSISYRIGVNGGTTGSGTTPTANTYFNDSTTMVAAGGNTPAAYTSGNQAGGTTANSVGGTKYAGGGGNARLSGQGGGGGGAAGLNGAGNTATTGAGASGDAGFGGAGGNNGSSPVANGGDGTEWDSTHGSGGGGEGGLASAETGGTGGKYGGGAGGNRNNPTAVGYSGLIVITYTPVSTVAFPNIPNLGM